MAAENQPNFALFTSSDLNFLTDELFTEMDFLTEQTETSETVNVAVITEESEQTERNGQQLDVQFYCRKQKQKHNEEDAK